MRTMLVLGLMSGCVTARNVSAARALTGCDEKEIVEIAAQPASTGYAVEPAPELSWYRACGKTTVCAPGPEGSRCFEAPVLEGGRPVVVEGERLRPRREYRLPGLTHAETVRWEELLAEREGLGQPGGPPHTSCWFGGGLGGGGGGEGAILLIPLIAVLGLIAIGCAAENAVEQGKLDRATAIGTELFELQRKLRPQAGMGLCSNDERAELARARVSASVVDRLCTPKVARQPKIVVPVPPPVDVDAPLSPPPMIGPGPVDEPRRKPLVAR